MATRVYCDRCGTWDKEGSKDITPVVVSYLQKEDNKGYSISDYDRRDIVVPKDLCPSCQKELLELFSKVNVKEPK